ncbi:MAG: hypothetical protein JJT76_04955 [Clostridiaceae bacterium]|nr:hypothetical protein [Clostridiaceae bacterium]
MKRWEIEVKYHQLKSRYELENFSGVNPIAIMQDFYATIYLSNLMAMVNIEANENAESRKENLNSLKFNALYSLNIILCTERRRDYVPLLSSS